MCITDKASMDPCWHLCLVISTFSNQPTSIKAGSFGVGIKKKHVFIG